MTVTQGMMLRNSSYTPEENRRLLMLLSAFETYLDEQDGYELLYSEKLGKFLRLTMEKLLWQDEPVSEIESSDQMFSIFMENICFRLAEPRYASAPDADELEFDEPELDEMRRQVSERLARLPDGTLRAYYTRLLNDFVREERQKAVACKRQIRQKRKIFNRITEVRA